jgi:O-antigen/teichoic acid export membrane protein
MRSRVLGQAAVFAVFNGLVSVLAAVASAILARTLTTDEFGSFSFALSLVLFASLFFDFGLFLPPARMGAKASAIERRRILAAALITYVPVGLAFSAAVFLSSLFVDDIFNVQAGEALRVASLLSIAYPFLYLAHWLGQGLGRLHVYSISTAAGQVLFVGVLAALVVASGDVGGTFALALRGVAVLAGALIFIAWMRPVFAGARELVPRITSGAREYGIHVWIGALLAHASYRTDVLILGAMVSASTVGFYVLATQLAMGSGLLMLGLASALFPRMAAADRIDPRWLRIAWGVSLAAAVVLWLLADPFIELVFSSRYLEAGDFVLPLALTAGVRGVTGVYNSFLSAQGRGRELRNAGLVLAAASLVLNFTLIPLFGAIGAAWGSLGAMAANYVAHVVGYRRSMRAGAAPAAEDESPAAPATL